MLLVKDPRTGEDAYINDVDGYRRDMATARPQLCAHSSTEARRWTNKNGALVIQAQCLSCGVRVGNQIKATNREAFPEADPSLHEALRTKDKTAIEAVLIQHIDLTSQRKDERSKAYETYMASDAWKAKREKVLRRCKGICEGCEDAPAAQVHHLTYEHFGDELLFELVGVCRQCHDKAHHITQDEFDPAATTEDQFLDIDESLGF
jgi:hypothetical protein